MLWAWAIWRLLIKPGPGHWNNAEVKLTILSGVECSGLYIMKRLLSFQRWWWHFCVGGSLHAWLRCNALNYIGQVTQPFLHCGRMYWYVSASWSCILKRAIYCILSVQTRCIEMCMCMYVHTHMRVYTYMHACMRGHTHTLSLVLSIHYLPRVTVSVFIQLCWTQWVRRLTKLSKLSKLSKVYMFSPFYHRYHC